MRALVAGGTGRLGRLLVANLVRNGVEVRVLTRDRRRAEPLHGLGVEVVAGDVRRPDTLPAAVLGVDVVVSAVQGFAGAGRGTPASVDRDGNAHLVAAAKDAHAAIVLVSVVGAAPDSPMELLRCKYAAEQTLQRSGQPATIVRATAFAELWAEIVGHGIVFGRGDNPINFVSVHDVADVVTRVVLDRSRAWSIVEVGGPQDWSLNELTALVREVRGRPRRVWHVPRSLLRALAPLHRQPRAALTMDTTDMTFHRSAVSCTGATEVRQALAPRRPPPGPGEAARGVRP